MMELDQDRKATPASVEKAAEPRRPGRKRLLVLGLSAAGILAAAAWFFFNDLPLPVTAADRAVLLTARDLEPWIPGLSRAERSESCRKRMTFLFGWGVDTTYRCISKELGLLCRITLRGSERQAQDTFEAGGAGTEAMAGVWEIGRTLVRILDPSAEPMPAMPAERRDGLLPWGDGSRAWTAPRDGRPWSAAFIARKGKRVFSVFLVGAAIADEDLRRILLPRLEALGEE